jgi:hypothetical protein
MGITYIVVVAAGADTVNDEGADLLDAREVGCCAHGGFGGTILEPRK